MALICVAGMNHSPPAATIRSPAMMPPLYPRRVASHPGGSDIRKLAEIVRELHPGGLGLAQAQLLLEVLVHHVDHSVAYSPKEEQRTDQNEREHQVVPVFAYEEALLVCAHGCVRTILTQQTCPKLELGVSRALCPIFMTRF